MDMDYKKSKEYKKHLSEIERVESILRNPNISYKLRNDLSKQLQKLINDKLEYETYHEK